MDGDIGRTNTVILPYTDAGVASTEIDTDSCWHVGLYLWVDSKKRKKGENGYGFLFSASLSMDGVRYLPGRDRRRVAYRENRNNAPNEDKYGVTREAFVGGEKKD